MLFRATTTAFIAALLVSTSSARAAHVTDVADAADGDDPFDANLEVLFNASHDSALLTRENFQPVVGEKGARNVFARELLYQRWRLTLTPRLEVGLFHDLAVFVAWPIVLSDVATFRFDPSVFAHAQNGQTINNSTLLRDGAPNVARSSQEWPETSGGDAASGRFGLPAKNYNDWRLQLGNTGNLLQTVRRDFDNPTFGVRYSPVNNERDDTKPTVTLQVDYTPSLFAPMSPGDVPLSADNPGPVADGAHKLHASVGMSKRYALFDPYVLVEYTLPFATSDLAVKLGYEPPMRGGVSFGTELIPWEDRDAGQSFSIDLGLSGTYVARGRDFSPVSDAFKELTMVEQHLVTSAHAGLFLHLLSYLQIDVVAAGRYKTEHVLTGEIIGADGAKDQNRRTDLELGRCGPTPPAGTDCERNPFFFNPVLDTPGRRVKLENGFGFDLMAHVAITF